MPQDYTYANARIRFRETRLLSDADIGRLLSAKDSASCMRILKDKGWGDSASDETPDEILRAEENKLWAFIGEIVPDKGVFDFFLAPNDFHNLKVSLKCITRGQKPDGMFIQNAVTDPQIIFDAVEKREYDRLPAHLSGVAKEAMTVLLQTSDGQLCDIIVDRACLDEVSRLKDESDSDIVRLYCELFVASADIRIAVRSAKTKKSHDFIARSLAQCSSLNVEKLALCASQGFDEIVDYLEETQYRSAVPALGQSTAAFEKWCDDYLTELLKPQKWEPFSIGPAVAYVIARENEIKAVRMILTGKMNALDEEIIRERLRKMYV